MPDLLPAVARLIRRMIAAADPEKFISDGFHPGARWPKYCIFCARPMMIVRPGDVRCPECDCHG